MFLTTGVFSTGGFPSNTKTGFMSCSRKVSVRKNNPVRGLQRRNQTSLTKKRNYFDIYGPIISHVFTLKVFVSPSRVIRWSHLDGKTEKVSSCQRSVTSTRALPLETGSEPPRYPRRWLSLRKKTWQRTEYWNTSKYSKFSCCSVNLSCHCCGYPEDKLNRYLRTEQKVFVVSVSMENIQWIQKQMSLYMN